MPRRLQGARPKACLEKRSNKTDPLKGSASETINFLLILRCYILQFVLDDCSPGLRRCCQSFLHLCSITDTLLQSWKNQTLGCNTPCHITSCHFSSWTCDWSVERCFEPCRIAVCFMDVMGRSCYIGCMSWDGHAASCHNDMSLVSLMACGMGNMTVVRCSTPMIYVLCEGSTSLSSAHCSPMSRETLVPGN